MASLDEQPLESIWRISITVFEVRMGLELVVDTSSPAFGAEVRQAARRGSRLTRAVLDRVAAGAAERIAASRQRAGLTLEIREVEIAGIASVRKGTLATQGTSL